ncbi:Endoribonuclease Dicer-like 4, partial [Mucuna pruriens]
MKLSHSVKNPFLGNTVVQDASSTSFNEESNSYWSTTSSTQTLEGTKNGTARSNLYEICAANRWKPPIFECCKEEGPSHNRMFTFRVIIKIEEASGNIIECYGAPHRKKKAAAEDAAEGALCYLKILDCFAVLLFLKTQQVESTASSSFSSTLEECEKEKEKALVKGLEAFLLCSLEQHSTFVQGRGMSLVQQLPMVAGTRVDM